VKKFIVACLCFLSAGCAARQSMLYWRVKDMVLGTGPTIELANPQQKTLLSITAKTLQEIMLVHLRMSRTAGVPSELYIVDGDEPNAFAGMINGYKVTGINLAMIKLIDGDIDEYAALIGHEVAHWAKGHGAGGKTRSHTLNAVGMAVGMGLSAAGVPAAGLISGLGVDLIDSSFNRDQEREADALSIDYMIANHYDPLAAVRLHRKFLKIDPSLRLPFLSSHPSGEERIRNLKAVIEEKQQQSTSKGSAEAKEMQEGGGERK
jgi:Zn-dependent protease with chaperone function